MKTLMVMLTTCLAVVLPVLPMALEGVNIMEKMDLEEQWSAWKAKFGQVYSSEEEDYRRLVFFKNLQEITEHNSKYPAFASYYKGLNQFSDFTAEEFSAYNKLRPGSSVSLQNCGRKHAASHSDFPATVDWRKKGWVTAVKNQGKCGSCWAFSTTGSVEGQHANKTGTLLSLSEQQLVSCDETNEGCQGGWMDLAFEYIMSQPGGLETEKEYPYDAKTGSCNVNVTEEKAKITGCVDVVSGDERALQDATAFVGPISVGIHADLNFMQYGGGVFTEPGCGTGINHGVLVVGYGTYQGQDYWLVKNSWGTDWGMNGYVMMARNHNNMCGIATVASYPTV